MLLTEKEKYIKRKEKGNVCLCEREHQNKYKKY